MNEAKDDGGPAFPSRIKTTLYREGSEIGTTRVEEGECGISVRDYFAAKAMAACVTAGRKMGNIGPGDVGYFALAATNSYRMADAMLAERVK